MSCACFPQIVKGNNNGEPLCMFPPDCEEDNNNGEPLCMCFPPDCEESNNNGNPLSFSPTPIPSLGKPCNGSKLGKGG